MIHRQSTFDVILFDLGGVLVELAGVATMMIWSRLDEREIWHRWLHSDAVRAFESGRAEATDFAAAVVDEFELDTTPQEFMEAFVAWPRGLYHGVPELLAELADAYHLACLSNTNHLHWERFERETPLLDSLHSHFVSHQIGALKPDPEIYDHVISALACEPARILFMDDNQINVDAAEKSGMRAVLTRGIDGVRSNLSDFGIL